jgi:Domain of unknown function (DUF4157)
MTGTRMLLAKDSMAPAVRPHLPVPRPILQRCGGEQCPPGTCDHQPLPSVVGEALQAPGERLDAATRAEMNRRFGYDFVRVRVHTDTRASAAARAVDAQAFTVGHDIVFGAGQFAPQTSAGRRLLVHEMTHVLQQQAAPSGATDRLVVGGPHTPAEREADAAAAAFGGLPPVRPRPAPDLLARQRIGRPGTTGPVLDPADPRLRDILEKAADPRRGSSGPSDPGCAQAVAEQPPWMPNLRRQTPIELGEGTRRSPKVKEPDGPSGAKCRGACGPDCPTTCKNVGTYTEQYVVGDCGYLIEFPNAILCGTHEGCRVHDACFDAAVANGETDLFGPRHNQCNQDALLRWPAHVKDWAQGGGPYDGWWHFVDHPVIRSSWRIRNAPGPTPSSH